MSKYYSDEERLAEIRRRLLEFDTASEMQDKGITNSNALDMKAVMEKRGEFIDIVTKVEDDKKLLALLVEFFDKISKQYENLKNGGNAWELQNKDFVYYVSLIKGITNPDTISELIKIINERYASSIKTFPPIMRSIDVYLSENICKMSNDDDKIKLLDVVDGGHYRGKIIASFKDDQLKLPYIQHILNSEGKLFRVTSRQDMMVISSLTDTDLRMKILNRVDLFTRINIIQQYKNLSEEEKSKYIDEAYDAFLGNVEEDLKGLSEAQIEDEKLSALYGLIAFATETKNENVKLRYFNKFMGQSKIDRLSKPFIEFLATLDDTSYFDTIIDSQGPEFKELMQYSNVRSWYYGKRKEIDVEREKSAKELSEHKEKEAINHTNGIIPEISKLEQLGIVLTVEQKEELIKKIKEKRLSQFNQEREVRSESQKKAIQKSKDLSSQREERAFEIEKREAEERLQIEEKIKKGKEQYDMLTAIKDLGIVLTSEQSNMMIEYLELLNYFTKKYKEFPSIEKSEAGIEQYGDDFAMNPEIRKQFQEYYQNDANTLVR